MDDVYKWYVENKLTLSIDKCSTMVINNDLKQDVGNFIIKLGNTNLEQVVCMKYLGVVIDNKLNWSRHIANVTKKVQCIKSKVLKTFNTLPRYLRLKYCNTSGIPILDYASTVWGHFSKKVKNVITKLEHMAARAISGNYDFIQMRGTDIMKELNMTFFENRLDYYHCLLVFKAIHGLVPDHIANNIIFSYEVSQRDLRTFNEMNLYKPKARCEIFKKSLKYHGANLWNGLPFDIKNLTTVSAFKKSYKTLFPLTKYQYE